MYKITNDVKLARKFKQEIAQLKKAQEKLYYKAVKILSLPDNGEVWDYFFNDQVGFSGVERRLSNYE